jgi:UDP-glucose 4-epimerase
MQGAKYILITGGAGYIGSHTVVELYASGYTPVIVDDFRNSNRIVLDGLKKITGHDLIIHEIDVCDLLSLEEIFKKYPLSGLIHFAAYKAVGESVAEPLKYYRNNLVGLINVLELVQKYELQSFVFSSSCTVYGDPESEVEVNENTPLSKAFSPYGNTKLIGEQIISDVFKSKPDLKMISLRYFNPIGAHPSGLIGEFPIGKPNNLLPFITQTAIGKQHELTVFGNDYPTEDGTCIRDYIHVTDLAKAHVKALELLFNKQKGYNDFINIGTGKGTSVLELITTFEKISGEKLNWKFGPRRPGDVTEIYANVSKSNETLDWKSEFTTEDAVRHAWIWEQKLLEYA